ncbi:Lrp/AsnC family transcriptional regulator (plasmid) [Microvirga terrae]|uniref:Lrp/AsnC family transcriptional regulator n=1 Tax=Microvirga terrae TaxID=2740529 RepID=A0ABY5S1R2_9HYPH|nr:Lrp/AsnC family transcriptional regulator [Microvirga terrae]UVF22209.1 Lrp/AsnC family transcriptional regulator [Microvirga terrae]
MTRELRRTDEIDKRVLRILQNNCALSVAEVADAAGISPTACWRRIQRLERDGVILRRVAVLDRKKLNVGVTVFVAIKTREHSASWTDQFRKALKDIPEIVDVYRMSGDVDYLIKAYVPDIETYDALYNKVIARVELSDVTSMFAMEEMKATTQVPLNYA